MKHTLQFNEKKTPQQSDAFFIFKMVLVLFLAVSITFLSGTGQSLRLPSMHSETLSPHTAPGIPANVPDYQNKLFDSGRIQNIDIQIEDMDAFLASSDTEEYFPADITINDERYYDVGIRIKGNNSRRLTESYGLKRFSFKIEFDHYLPQYYHGLDKFSLDASFQDNSYLKTMLALDMMRFMQVATPLCSFSTLSFNGEYFGLYLAVEEPEESFAKRNFGDAYGKLYKPDYKSLNDVNADVALLYTDDRFESYDNIFRKSKFKIGDADRIRLIIALKNLNSGSDPGFSVNIDSLMRYFPVQVFVLNLDGYLGKNAHNYFLYEENGILSMLPWDYNLAFTTYSLGMPEPIDDATYYVNHPVNTPASWEIMKNRPMFHKVMKHPKYFRAYHDYFDYFIREYFESGYFEERVDFFSDLIAPHVQNDPTAFCNFEEHRLGVHTIRQFCLLRAKSIRLQLDGKIPATIAGQRDFQGEFVNADSIRLPDMGAIHDLKE